MLSKTSANLTREQFLPLIEQAEIALSLRDLETVQSKISSVWTDFEKDPELSGIDELTSADLLQVCGSFLILHGNFRGLKDSQIHARNLLTKAIEIFEDHELYEKAAKAKLYFGYSYFNTDEVNEFDTIYDLLEEEAKNQKWQEILLLARINRLIVFTLKENFDAANNLINQNAQLFNKSDNLRLKGMFFLESGIFYHQRKKFKLAKKYLTEAVNLFRKLEIERFEASSLNSLSLVYKDLRDFSKAHHTCDQSFSIYLKLKDYGSVPHILDSKALIYIEEKNFDEALKLVDVAINEFSNTDDVRGLLDAMWTRCICLFSQKRSIDALAQFLEIHQTAIEKVGEVIAEKYLRYFDDKIYFIEDLPLREEIANFKKNCVSRAIQKADGKITKAAKILGYKHQTVSNIKNNLFPELQSELKLKPRAKRSDSKNRENEVRSITKTNIRNEAIRDETKKHSSITRMFAQGGKFLFNFNESADIFIPYVVRESVMSQFGIDFDCVVAVAPAEFLADGDYLLYRIGEEADLGRVTHERDLNFFLIEKEFESVFLDDSNIIGKPIGFCRYNAENDPEYIFQPLPV